MATDELAAMRQRVGQLEASLAQAEASGGPIEEACAQLRELVVDLERLVDQAEEYRMVFVESPLGIAFYDVTGKLTNANRAFLNLAGLPDIAAASKMNLLENPQLLQDASAKLLRGEPVHLEQDLDLDLLKRLTGASIARSGKLHLEGFLVPLKTENGGVHGFLVQIADVSRRQRAEIERDRLAAEVQRRVAELDATINGMPAGVILFGRSGDIVRVNPAAERMLGGSPAHQESGAMEWLQRMHPETPEGTPLAVQETPISRALRGETLQDVVMVLQPSPERTLWVCVTAAPVASPDGQRLGTLVVLTDVTSLRRWEEQRQRYVLGISHGLRTPLTVIQGQAQLLLRALEKAGLTGREVDSARTILTGAMRMSVVIRDLVDLSEIEAGRPLELHREQLDLHTFLLRLKQQPGTVLASNRIRIDAPKGLPPALADPDRLERILTNLLANALKFSYPETEVTLRLSRRGDEVLISVSDRGPGISAEECPLLFDPYRRLRVANGRRESVGFGLYVTKGLVEAHGGKIWAESEVGKGSTFHITLPSAA